MRNRFVVVLGLLPAALLLTVQAPVTMVMIGGIVQAVMLPVIGAGANFPPPPTAARAIAPFAGTTAALWITTAAMVVMMGYYAAFIARG